MKTLIYLDNSDSDHVPQGVDTVWKGGFYNKEDFELLKPQQYQTFLKNGRLELQTLYDTLNRAEIAIEVIQNGAYTPIQKSSVQKITLDYQSNPSKECNEMGLISVAVNDETTTSLKKKIANSLSYAFPERFPAQSINRYAERICDLFEDYIYRVTVTSVEDAKHILLQTTSDYLESNPASGNIVVNSLAEFQQSMADALKGRIMALHSMASTEDKKVYSLLSQVAETYCNPETGRMNILLLPDGKAEVFTTGAPQQQQQQQQQAKHIPSIRR